MLALQCHWRDQVWDSLRYLNVGVQLSESRASELSLRSGSRFRRDLQSRFLGATLSSPDRPHVVTTIHCDALAHMGHCARRSCASEFVRARISLTNAHHALLAPRREFMSRDAARPFR